MLLGKGVFPVVLGFGLCVFQATASAYILPASAILESVGTRRKELGFKSMILRGQRLDPKTNGMTKTIWRLIVPGQGIRTEFKSADTTRVQLLVNRKRFEFTNGNRPLKGKKIKASLELDFLAATSGDSGGKRGLTFLKAHEIDRKIVSFGRMNKRVVWIIGANSDDQESPQLWIDKNLRVPVRLIYTEKTSGEKIDIRFLGFGSPQTREWHPRQVDTFRNNELVERLVFHRVSINSSVDFALLAAPKTK
jgi:hypothetical protein